MENLALAAIALAIALLERVPRLRFNRSPLLRRHFGTDLFYLATSAVGLGVLMRMAGIELTTSFGVLAPGLAALPVAFAWLAAVVLYDLSAFLVHVLLHRSQTLWRFHKVHHSSRQLDWLATFRAHAVEHGLRHTASTVALLAIGFPVSTVAAAALVHTSFALLGHSNLRLDLRMLEPLLITPRLHRLHHVPATSEANLGSIFSVWDRLRGQLVSDPAARMEPLGVPGELETYPQTWLPQFVEPFRRPGRSEPQPTGEPAPLPLHRSYRV